MCWLSQEGVCARARERESAEEPRGWVRLRPTGSTDTDAGKPTTGEEASGREEGEERCTGRGCDSDAPGAPIRNISCPSESFCSIHRRCGSKCPGPPPPPPPETQSRCWTGTSAAWDGLPGGRGGRGCLCVGLSRTHGRRKFFLTEKRCGRVRGQKTGGSNIRTFDLPSRTTHGMAGPLVVHLL